MADKKKKNKGAADASNKPAAAKQAEAETSSEHEAEETAHARDAEDEGGHAPAAAHGHAGGHAAGEHAPNRKEYMIIFGLLALLTALEVAVTKVPGIGKTGMGLSLVGMALTKAALVGLFFMHLKHETRFLRLSVALPMLAPAIYAIVLMSEAAWRYR